MSLLQSFALVALGAAPAAAFWRLPCASPVVVERADPIVNAGTVSGHLHTVMGGNAFDFTMDYKKTQTSDCTSCQVHGDLSNYWIPSLYYKHQNGTFEQVKQTGGMLAYYLQRKGKDSEKLHAFPEGFRMVAGNPYKRSGGDDFASQAISYHCLDYSGKTSQQETGGFPNYNCPDGLRSQVFFPACWDGKNLDSEDHKSHVAYPVTNYNNGACPDSHPVHLISLFYEVIWDTDKFSKMWYGGSQPFVWSMGDPTGYGLHGDFLNGWDVDLLQRAVDGCTNDSGRVEDCGEFKLYTAQEAGQCKKKSTLTEALNYVEALPGCNPISNGPALAVKPATCAANPTIPGGSGGTGSGDDSGNGTGDDTGSGDDSGSGSGGSGSGGSGSGGAATTSAAGTKNSMTTVYKTSSKAAATTKSATYNNGKGHSGATTQKQAQSTDSVAPGSFYPSQTYSYPAPSSYTTSAAESSTSTSTSAAAATTTGAATYGPGPVSGPAPGPSEGPGEGHCKHKKVITVTETETSVSTVLAKPIATPQPYKKRHAAQQHGIHRRSGRMGPAYHH